MEGVLTMPYYAGLKQIADSTVRTRTVQGLKRLRAALAQSIPPKRQTDCLLLATWNIRELDSGKYGHRTEEQYYYIAEILSRFDLVAIQEVRDGLYPLQRLQRLLGSWWDFIVTDVTLGRSGNAERMAYLFDKRKVSFGGLAAELVLPKVEGADQPPLQLARSPYVAGFKAGWAYLTLVTVHIYYGKSTPIDPRRLEEIKSLGETIAKNAPKFSCAPQYEPGMKPVADNLFVLGDFNIFKREDVTMRALTDAGFLVPAELQAIPGSNVAKDKHYDQIAYLKKLSRMQSTGKAGVFDFFEHVYRLDQEDEYSQDRGNRGSSYKEWRTYRMSDHLPMWIEFAVDDTDAYLNELG